MVGIPFGALCAFRYGMGYIGLWVGLLAGELLAADKPAVGVLRQAAGLSRLRHRGCPGFGYLG